MDTPPIDPKELALAERNAARHNAKQAAALPLFAQAGILAQVADLRTAEDVIARRRRFRADFKANMERWEADVTARIAVYRAALADAGALHAADAAWDEARHRYPAGLAYQAGHYWQALRAARPDARWEDYALAAVGERITDEYRAATQPPTRPAPAGADQDRHDERPDPSRRR